MLAFAARKPVGHFLGIATAGKIEDIGAVVCFEIVASQRQHRSRSYVRFKREARCNVARVVGVLRRIVGADQGRKAIAVFGLHRDPGAKAVCQRSAYTAREPHEIKITYRQSRVRLQRVAWASAHDIDRTACGIAPIKGALWTAQDFDPLHIEKRRPDRSRPAEKRTIEIGGGRTVVARDNGGCPNPANEDRSIALIARNLDARSNSADVLDRSYRAFLKHLITKSSHRQRRILQVAFAPRCGDHDDVLVCVLSVGLDLCVLRLQWRGCDRGRAGEQRQCKCILHFFPLPWRRLCRRSNGLVVRYVRGTNRNVFSASP